MSGGRFALAAAWVFGAPLACLIAAQVALAPRLGELPALGVGLTSAATLLIPAWFRLRRPPGQEVPR